MKNKFRSLSIIALVVAMTTVVAAKANYYPVNVQNATTHNVGVVTVTQQSGSPIYINVTGQGTFTGNLTSAPTAAIINGYVTAQGSVGYATTSTGFHVKVDFSQGNNIVVQDQQIIQ
jgi:hypothetical protein